ncbi:hypothetical protein LVJ94_21065 [Pendulispora rubella]|uniref:Cysteine-rich CPCC domain-containing protein n=1 Tax=Pendulispora rubella TaxID=2741070 RepID=A0ABZ2LG30_9BACT
MNHPCPCCGNLTLSEAPPNTFEVCPVCHWEDDGVQFEDPDFEGGANDVSLRTARANYAEFAASDRRFLDQVRKPHADEIPKQNKPGQT